MRFQVILNPAAFKAAITAEAKFIVQDVVFDLKAKFAELFGGLKTGRIYRRPRPLSGTYQASAPGEPPALRTGNLFRSIRESFPEPLTGQIVIGAEYARHLEEGTAQGLAPRPFVRPAIVAVTKQFNSVSSRFLGR